MENPEMTLRQAVLETVKMDEIPEFGTPEYMELLNVLKRENPELCEQFVEVMREDETPQALEIPASLKPHLQRAARRETVQQVKRATMQKKTPDGRWVPNKTFIMGMVAVAVLGGFFMVMTAQNASSKKQEGGNLLGAAVGMAGKGNELTENTLDPATDATVDVQPTKPMFGASNETPNPDPNAPATTANPSADPASNEPTSTPLPSDPSTAPVNPNVNDTSQPQFQAQNGQSTTGAATYSPNTATSSQATASAPRASTSANPNSTRTTPSPANQKKPQGTNITNQPKTFSAISRVVRAGIGINPNRQFVGQSTNPNATKPTPVQTISNSTSTVGQTSSDLSNPSNSGTGITRTGGNLTQTAVQAAPKLTTHAATRPNTVNAANPTKTAQSITATSATRSGGTVNQAATRPSPGTNATNITRPNGVILSNPTAPQNRVSATSTTRSSSVTTNSATRPTGVSSIPSTVPQNRVSNISSTRTSTINPIATSRPNGLTIIPRPPTTVVFRPGDGAAPTNNVASIRADQSSPVNTSTGSTPAQGMTTVYQRDGAGSNPNPAPNPNAVTAPDPFSAPQAAPTSAPPATTTLAPSSIAQTPPGITVGMRIPAKLITTIYTAETATTPVLVQTELGLWLGRATLGSSKRVELIFEKMIDPKGTEYAVQALGYDTNLTQGLACSIELVAPTLATDLLQSSLSGLSTYLSGQLGAGTTTTTPIGGSTQTRNPPSLLDSILGTIGGIFKLPESNQTIVRVAKVDKDTPLTIVYGVSLPSAPSK
jgi:hypothetical protein